MDEDFRERLLKANANVDYMAHQFAEVLRNCIRASAASDPSSQTFHAAQNFEMLLQLIVRSEGVPIYDLMARAIEALSVKPSRNLLDDATTRAAQMGARLLV